MSSQIDEYILCVEGYRFTREEFSYKIETLSYTADSAAGPWRWEVHLRGFDEEDVIIFVTEYLGDEHKYIEKVLFKGNEWDFDRAALSESRFYACLKQVIKHQDNWC